MSEALRLVLQIAVALVMLAVAVWFGTLILFLLLGLFGVAFIVHWLRRAGIIGSQTPPGTSYSYEHEEFQSDGDSEKHVTIIETEFHEVKDGDKK